MARIKNAATGHLSRRLERSGAVSPNSLQPSGTVLQNAWIFFRCKIVFLRTVLPKFVQGTWRSKIAFS
jgi:hypothetical protein